MSDQPRGDSGATGLRARLSIVAEQHHERIQEHVIETRPQNRCLENRRVCLDGIDEQLQQSPDLCSRTLRKIDTSTPVITADWEADSDDRWTVPLGGLGSLVRFGKTPVDLKAQVFYNVEAPKNVGDWSSQFQVKLLFPK